MSRRIEVVIKGDGFLEKLRAPHSRTRLTLRQRLRLIKRALT